MQKDNLHKMVKQLGDNILKVIHGPMVIAGIVTGGEIIAKKLHNYFKSLGIECSVLSIQVDKERNCIIRGEELIKKGDAMYIFVDDAIWSSDTKHIVEKYAKDKEVAYKFAVILDPTKKADFSVYS